MVGQQYISSFTNYHAGSYRFGFNGQEKDQEIYNNQSTTTAMFWEYDGRIGRRWNGDPVEKEKESSYSCFSNSPIFYQDLFGDLAGDYLTKNGEYLGSDGKDDNIGYTVEKSDVKYKEDGKTVDSDKTKNKKEFTSEYSGFVDMSAVIYGESTPEAYSSTAHIIKNMQELGEYAASTPGISDKTKSNINTNLTDIANASVSAEYGDMNNYKNSFGWNNDKNINNKNLARAAAISALTRSNSDVNGGLLKGGWNANDPTKGAIQWKGSVYPIGSKNCKYATKKEFEDHYNNVKQYGVKKWDTRFYYFKNGTGAVFEKASDSWIKAYVEKCGGSKAYPVAKERGRGVW